jgi:hypothetical protein
MHMAQAAAAPVLHGTCFFTVPNPKVLQDAFLEKRYQYFDTLCNCHPSPPTLATSSFIFPAAISSNTYITAIMCSTKPLLQS